MQRELGLGSTLVALKHYFLLDRGDLVMTFLDTAEGELAKPATEASLARLQAQLDLGVLPVSTRPPNPILKP
jgi:gamma-tubulin complex component 2